MQQRETQITKRRSFASLFMVPLLAVLLSLFVRSTSVQAQPAPGRGMVDQIVAVVGDTVILASELEMQMQLIMLQEHRQITNEAEARKLRSQILNDMINEQLFIASAREDTTIEVRDEEVEAAIDNQIARVSSGFKSNEDFLSALASEGLTLRELRKQYHDGTRNQLLKQRAMQRRFYTVSVSRHEVEEYYHQFKDSLPNQPEAARLARIVLPIMPGTAVEDSVKNLANSLRQQALSGTDFAVLSSHYSMPGVRENGGDLGFVESEDMVPEFSRAAFNLSPGEVSGVVRTQFGYHVIKCEGKDGNKLHLRHILLPVIATAQDTARTMRLGDSLVTEIKNGADFGEMAKAFSTDNETRAQGGEMGWVALRELPEKLFAQVKGWQTVGEVRGPVVASNGVQILKLLEYSPEKVFTIDNDYDRIKDFARQDKAGKEVDAWVAELRKNTYVETRMDDAN